MGIYIREMSMPKSCKECPLSDHEAWCLIPGDWRKRYYCPSDEVSSDCPMVEVPEPHGDLIDRDALKETIVENVYPVADCFNSRDYGMFWTGGIEKAIDEQPTVIERSEDDKI